VTGAKLDFTGPQKTRCLSTWARKVLACLKLLAKLLTGCLSTLPTRRYVAAVPNIEEGFGKSGRSMSDFDVGAYNGVSVGLIGEGTQISQEWLLRLLRWALRACARATRYFHSVRLKPSVQLSEQVKWGESGRLVDDNMIDAFVIAWRPDTCNKKIEALLDNRSDAGHNWQPNRSGC